jgi:hydroxyethylthiazole kinase-like uncharacterized protein yjeF
MKLVTIAEMQTIERQADESGLSYDQMMENAGLGLAQVVEEEYRSLKGEGVMGLIGSGNNGGDTLVALRYLANWGWKTTAVIVRPRTEGDPLEAGYTDAGGHIVSLGEQDDQLQDLIETHAVLCDGVLGTGIRLPLHGRVAETLNQVRKLVAVKLHPPYVVAVDLPSGVDGDTGEVAPETVPADLTVTMAAVKLGLLKFPACQVIGKLRVVGIGLTDQKAWLAIKRQVADDEMVRSYLPTRPADAHKGTFGTTLVIAGSINYTGAPMLAGKAAYRVGSGLVTLAVPAPLHAILAGHFAEATWLLLPHDMGVIASDACDVIVKNLERITSVLIGPGFGMEDTTKEFLARIIGAAHQGHRGTIGFLAESSKENAARQAELPPVVIDADGLKILAGLPDWEARLPAPAVLTPHPGEMAVLTGLSVKEIQASRLETVEQYAKKWGHVVVLKGANTIVAAPDGQTTFIPVATAALARAGTGDVLAGLIAGLRSQGVEAYPAAIAGCYIHASAGLRAEAHFGNSASVLAGDILSAVAEVLTHLNASER